MKRVKKSDLIADIVKCFPKVAEILARHDLHCSTCFMSQIETLELGAKVHGMTEGEIDKLVKEINLQLKKESK